MFEFWVLGPLQVRRDGKPVALNALMVRRVLAVLLCRAGRPVTADQLAEALWPDDPPPTARKTLQGYVHRLRRALGEPSQVSYGPAGYSIAVAAGELDASRFATLVERAQDSRRRADLDRAAVAWREALGLWRGAAYADIVAGDLVADESCRLEEQRLLAHEERIALDLDLGRDRELVAELATLARAHPYRERLRALCMLASYRAGRLAEALAAFRETRARLREELGVEPGALLQRLHQAMLRGDERLARVSTTELELLAQPGPEGSGSRRAASSGPVPPRELPADVAGFTGRREQLKALDGMLPDGGSPALISVLAGTAGAGKTALAVHWAHQVANRFPDGQLFLNLRGYATSAPLRPIEALAALLRSLGTSPDQIPSEEAHAASLYRSQLAGRRVLVLLDNAGSLEQVRPLLPGGPGAFVLVTSRDRLSGLVARDGARRLTVEMLTPDEAHALLARLLGPERVETERDATAKLAAACAYLPLALRIVAANLADNPHRTIAAQLAGLAASDRLAALQAGDDQESAVRAALDLSYQAIPSAAQQLFGLLGLVPGLDVTAGAAAALARTSLADVLPLLDRLASVHLVDQHAPDRYTFHDLLRIYARERAQRELAAPARRDALERLLGWYLQHAEAARRLLYPSVVQLPAGSPRPAREPAQFSDNVQALAWLDAEVANVVAAVRHAADHGPRPAAWLLSDALRGYIWIRMRGVDGLVLGRAGLVAAEAEGDLPGGATAHLSLAAAHLGCGEYRQAIVHGTRATTLAGEIEWPEGRAAAHYYASIACGRLGRLPEAVEHGTRALRLNRRLGRRSGTAANLGGLGVFRWEQGHLREAARLYAEALALARERGDGAHQALQLANLGEVYQAMGQLDRAAECLDGQSALQRAGGYQVDEPENLRLLADRCLVTGRLTEALRHATMAVTLTRDTGDRRKAADALNTLAAVQLGLGHHREAIRGYQHALDRAGPDTRYPRTGALVGLAAAWHRLADFPRASAHAQEALRCAREVGYRLLEGQALTTLAEIGLGQGQHAEAHEQARQALANHRETGHRPGEARTLALLGRLAAARADPAAAQQHRQAALDLFEDIGAPVPPDLRVAAGG